MRKSLFALLATTLGLTACTEMTDFYADAETTTIEGETFFVLAQPHLGPGVYLSGLNTAKPSEVFGIGDMSLPARNVAAIEKHTGCKALPATIKNNAVGTSYAAVRC